MKNIKFTFHFVKKNIFPILLTSLILAVSIFSIITLFGKYQYKAYTYDVFKNSELQNAVYVMPAIMNRDGTETSKPYRSVVAAMDGVENVITFKHSIISYDQYPLNVYYYPDDMIKNFQLKVAEGRWLEYATNKTEAVIGGTIWSGVNVGDSLVLSNGVTCEVVGIIPDLAVYPAFSRYNNSICPTDNMFKALDNAIFLNADSIDLTCVTETNIREPTNFFVNFEATALHSQKESVIGYLKNIGIVRDYDFIINDTKHLLREWVWEQFPLPLFLIVIGTINIICICAIMINRSLPDISKYYLFGCTQKHAYFCITGGLIFIFSIPALLNIVLSLIAPHFIRYTLNNRVFNYLIDMKCAIPVLFYLLFIGIIIIILSTLCFRKYSPFDFYRRNL